MSRRQTEIEELLRELSDEVPFRNRRKPTKVGEDLTVFLKRDLVRESPLKVDDPGEVEVYSYYDESVAIIDLAPEKREGSLYGSAD